MSKESKEEQCEMCLGQGWWSHPLRPSGKEYCKCCEKGKNLKEQSEKNNGIS